MAGFPEQTTDRIRKALPERALIGKRATATARQGIHPPLPAGVAHGPAAAQRPGLLETVERRVDRAFRQVECATAAVANLLNDGIAMGRHARQRGEHDHVEMTFEHFTFHECDVIPSNPRRQRGTGDRWMTRNTDARYFCTASCPRRVVSPGDGGEELAARNLVLLGIDTRKPRLAINESGREFYRARPEHRFRPPPRLARRRHRLRRGPLRRA